MPEALLLLAAFVCGVIGLALLALAMEPHWRQVRGGQPLAPSTTRVLRVLGSFGLAASLLLCFLVDHPSMAALVWIMGLAAAALLVAFTFTWRPRTFAPLVWFVSRKALPKS